MSRTDDRPIAADQAGDLEWTIERITSPAGLDEVMVIERESFRNPWTREMFEWELGNAALSRLYVVRAEGRVVAFCSVWIVVDELHINNLAVASAYRRRGFARRLLEHVIVEGEREGAVRATLEVRRSNEAAIQLYHGLGFEIAGTRRDYYTNPVEDALILWRNTSEKGPPDAAGRA